MDGRDKLLASRLDQRRLQSDIRNLTKKATGLLSQMNQQLLRLRDKNQQLATESSVIYVQLSCSPSDPAVPALEPAPDAGPDQQLKQEQPQQQQATAHAPEAPVAAAGAAAGSGSSSVVAHTGASLSSSTATNAGGTSEAGPSSSSNNSQALVPASAAARGKQRTAMEVPRDVALMCPFIQREILANGVGLPGNPPVCLPKQVTENSWDMVLEYCRFHQVPGRSDKERRMFDERFIKVDTNLLCELTSAADALDMRPLVDLASRAIAKMIEGKTPEQIREAFRLPDDLTEEEKLEPLRTMTDDPRIRMLNRLYAKKRRELQQRKQQQDGSGEGAEGSSSATNAQQAAKLEDDRPIDELLSFIEAEGDKAKAAAGGSSKPKAKRKKAKQRAAKPEDAAAAGGSVAAAGEGTSKGSTAPGSSRSSQDSSPVRGTAQAAGSSARAAAAAAATAGALAAVAAHQAGPQAAPPLLLAAQLPAGRLLWEESEGDEDEEPDMFSLAARTSLLHRPVTQLTSLTAFRLAQQAKAGATAAAAYGGSGSVPGSGSPASAVDRGQTESDTGSSSEEEEAGPLEQSSRAAGVLGSEQEAAAAAAQGVPLASEDVAQIAGALQGFLAKLGLDQRLAVVPAPDAAASRRERVVGSMAAEPVSHAVELPGGGTLKLQWSPPPDL